MDNGFDESVDLPSDIDTDSDAELPPHMDGVQRGSDLRVPTPEEAGLMPRSCLKFAEYYSPPRVARLLTHLLTIFLSTDVLAQWDFENSDVRGLPCIC